MVPAVKEEMETTGTQPALDTPLAEFHRRAGAKVGLWFGCSLPDDFGDWTSEYWFAHKTVALIDKNYRAYLSFAGQDRTRYLNAILTNNIKDLQPSHGIVSLLLNPQGHILAEIETYNVAESLFCVSYGSIRERLIETLDKFIIMDDVTLTDETQRYATLGLEGPAAAQLVSQLTGIDLNELAALGRREAQVDSIPCVVVRRSPGKTVDAEFLVEKQHVEALWTLLEAKTRAVGGGPMGYSALSALRLEQGVPWFGYDFGEKQIPHEAGLQDSHISYTKGCYTGQEIVERVRSRGQVNRRRVVLAFTGTGVPAAGEALTVGGKEVGFVTRAAFSPLLSHAIGMGYVRKEGQAPGSELEWRGGSARVSE
jgi:folate-binding protein YgfZ